LSNGTRQYVSFDLDGRLYGLDIRIVKEVNPNTVIALVPRSPEHIRGLVNIRGQVVLVIDVAVVFGKAARPVTDTSQIIIFKTAQEIRQVRNIDDSLALARFGDKPVGFLVDGIGDVVTVTESNIAPPPPHLTECNARYVEGVVQLEERLLVILNATNML